MIKIKVLVSDFDKTLYRNPQELRENVKLINEFMKDNKFIIATGRAIYDIKPLINKYKIKYDYLICNDGGLIFDSFNNKLLEININNDVIKKIINYLENNNINYYFLDNGEEKTLKLDKYINAIIIRDKEREKSKKILEDILKLDESINGYISDNWINITNKKVSKGNAIEFLSNKFNINRNDIFVIGDNLNDLSMIEKFNGYTMNNGENIIKTKSKKVFNNMKEFINYISEV